MRQPIADLDKLSAFCEGIQYFSEALPDIERLGDAPVLSETETAH